VIVGSGLGRVSVGSGIGRLGSPLGREGGDAVVETGAGVLLAAEVGVPLADPAPPVAVGVLALGPTLVAARSAAAREGATGPGAERAAAGD
jgi:hypothetical protein